MRRTNDPTFMLPDPVQDLGEMASPALRDGMTRRNGRWVDPADVESSGGRQRTRADDNVLEVPSIDWSEIASPAITRR